MIRTCPYWGSLLRRLLVSLNRFSAPNPERYKIRSTVGERGLGGVFITIYSAFSQRGEEGEQSIVSLESGDGFAGRG
jgi:hypothetical protein